MRRKLLVSAVGMIRMHDLHQLHLVELVLADHAARVLAVGAGFGAEARRMADELERQLFERHDLVAHEVGDRVLGGRNQVEVAALDLEQVVLEHLPNFGTARCRAFPVTMYGT